MKMQVILELGIQIIKITHEHKRVFRLKGDKTVLLSSHTTLKLIVTLKIIHKVSWKMCAIKL
jgi:hypothetical protein